MDKLIELANGELEKEEQSISSAENSQNRPHGEDEMQDNQSTLDADMNDENLSPKDKLQKQLEAGVREVMNSEQFKNWLSTGSRMFTRQYSFQNALLVWMQKPDASYTMGYDAWKEYGRNVAQGATGAKIFTPIMAYEKTHGALFRTIKAELTEQLAKDRDKDFALYKLGNSKLEFTMNRNHLIGIRIDGKEKGVFNSDEEVKRFIERSVIGKMPVGFTIGTVFDAKDTTIPEHLWVKRGYTKDEVVKDDNGKPIKNRRGEVKIINTPERQARFQTSLDMSIVAKDPAKMEKLFDACVAASERKGVPVYLCEKGEDDTLNGGAKGYFSRMKTAERPNGFIVIDKSLEPTEKCAVLLHEMSHADLHGNLEALAKRMGEDKIPKEMREVQAEASAFATASRFGIETDTSSFSYLAVYARGFEQQDFQRSLEVIYKEMKDLTDDIKAELDIRGLTMELTKKEKSLLEADTVKRISAKYVDFATTQDSMIISAQKELPSLAEQYKNNVEVLDILRCQNENLASRKQDVEGILIAVESFNAAQTREEQDMQLSILESAVNRVQEAAATFETLTERFIVAVERGSGDLKAEFNKNPKKTLEAMKQDFPRLGAMAEPQVTYIATSKFVANEYGKLLRNDPQAFVDKACDRAEQAARIAAKNGTFVEVNFCEQWTEQPIFENGTLCHPKIAEKIIAGSEAQIQGMRFESEKNGGDYVPYTKCDLTLYTPAKDGRLLALNTRVDIGDGGQTGLSNHLESVVGRSKAKREVLENFTAAVAEKGKYKDKIITPHSIDVEPKADAKDKTENAITDRVNQSHEDWGAEIVTAKETAQNEKNNSDKSIAESKQEHTGH